MLVAGPAGRGNRLRVRCQVYEPGPALLRPGDVLRIWDSRLRLDTSSRVEAGWLAWQGGLVVSMARQMNASRDFGDMPVLADALEDAGCSDPEVLTHCRLPGEHARGCWVVDLLQGKQ
jgi:hypothetical protein